MADLKIYPSRLEGEVKIPPSKSMAHRAIICAALSDGFCKIENIDYSQDIIATIDAMNSLGADIRKYDSYIEVNGAYKNINEIKKVNNNENSIKNSTESSTESSTENSTKKNTEKSTENSLENSVENSTENRVIDCNESGSTLRFLVPISLLFEGSNKFIGRGNLGKRPLTTYYNIFEKQGITYSYEEDKLNLLVSGKLQPGIFEVEGNVSSQFITGMLFTLPLLKGDSKIIITTEMESKGYIDLTLRAISDFGIEVINNDYKEFIIRGNQKYNARNYRVEGDYSQAAFFLCADSIGNDVLCKDLDLNSLQGDKEVIDILERMNVVFEAQEAGVKGSVCGELKSTVIDGSQCPDIIPVLSAVAALTKGTTEIINAGRLRIKECDRLTAIAIELNKLGANIIEKEDGLIITGALELKGNVEVWSHKDHRIAMTLAIASTRCEEAIVIKDYECIAKSYPNFFEDFVRLGGRIEKLEEK